MHFPRFWIRTVVDGITAWGWSDSSEAEAQSQADARLQRIRAWVAEERDEPLGRYGYPDRPFREPVLREFRAADGQLAAAVSRNSYGCLVLNTANLMFVDVDDNEPPPSGGSFLAKLFGGGKRADAAPVETRVRKAVEDWLKSKPDWNWRLYRTRAGFRLVAAHALVSPEAPDTQTAFETFGADKLYRALCKTQACFRARLTPKPWRCEAGNPRHRWPFADAGAEAAFQEWDRGYLRKAGGFATCELLGHFGNPNLHPALRELVEFHDATTRATTKLPLA